MSQTDRLAFALEAGDLALPAQGIIGVIRAEPSAFLSALPRDRLLCEQTDRSRFDQLHAEDLPVATHLDCTGAAMIVVNLTRSKPESRGNVARGFQCLAPGGQLVLNGAKTDGIDSLAREIARVIPLETSCAKAHGRVVIFRRPDTLPPVMSDWIAEVAPSRSAEGLWTRPGTFSAGAIDPGSRLLAGQFGPSLSGRVADLGAGWGYLSRACLAACPKVTAIDLYEAEKLALELAERNVTDPRAAFHWADVLTLPKVSPGYDVVITNPPFHRGRAAEPDLGAGFIATAARILKPTGRLLMVANRHLPYEARLDTAFRTWEQVADTPDFKVILATSPRRR